MGTLDTKFMKIYFANSLANAPEEYRRQMTEMREKLKGSFEVLEYFGLGEGTAEEIYKHDLDCLQKCDLVLAEVSQPSTGVGFEIATALGLGKKVLAAAAEDAIVSRMIMGIIHPNYKFIRYTNPGEVLNFDFKSL